jgi:hypothetical protein
VFLAASAFQTIIKVLQDKAGDLLEAGHEERERKLGGAILPADSV